MSDRKPATDLASAIRQLQDEIDSKIVIVEELREKYNPDEVDYYKYLKTTAWENMRQKVFRRDGFKCVVCGEAKNLECHHITYDNLGAEKVSDLVTLCKECHEKTHAGDDVENLIESRRAHLNAVVIELNKRINEFNRRQKEFETNEFMDETTQHLFACAIALGDDYVKLDDILKIDSVYIHSTTRLYGFTKHINEGKPVSDYDWGYDRPPFDVVAALSEKLPDILKGDKDKLMHEYLHYLGIVSVDNARHFLDVATKGYNIPRATEKYELMRDLAYQPLFETNAIIDKVKSRNKFNSIFSQVMEGK